MSQQHHVIGKTILKIDTGQLGDVWSLQEDLSRLLWQRAVPQLETLFDRLVTDNEVVCLDQVTVELKPIDSRFLADEFIQHLIDALEQNLGDYLAGYNPETVTASRERLDRPTADGEIFWHFLRYGRLPWSSPAETWETWLGRWQAALQNHAQWRGTLRSLLTSHPEAIDRLTTQFPESFRHQLVLQMQPTWGNWHALLNQAQQLTAALHLTPSHRDRLTRHAWQKLLALLSRSSLTDALPASTWARQWLPQLVAVWLQANAIEPMDDSSRSGSSSSPASLPSPAAESPLLGANAVAFLETLIATTLTRDRSVWQRALQQVLATQVPPQFGSGDSSSTVDEPSDSSPDAEERLPEEGESAAPGDILQRLTGQPGTAAEERLPEEGESTVPGDILQRLTGQPSAATESSALSTDEETAGLYLNQAGVVLLHPFLSRYFEAVGLLADNQFQNTDCQQRAICLLHYLATRQTDPPEYELVLPKLLCGWSLNEPVIPAELPQAALDEAEHLLQTVIDYWQALKSTSPDGLREGFLRREGKLRRTGDRTWKLQVEQKAIDILLSRLPWGVSMVKLPWMDDLLAVEWT